MASLLFSSPFSMTIGRPLGFGIGFRLGFGFRVLGLRVEGSGAGVKGLFCCFWFLLVFGGCRVSLVQGLGADSRAVCAQALGSRT